MHAEETEKRENRDMVMTLPKALEVREEDRPTAEPTHPDPPVVLHQKPILATWYSELHQKAPQVSAVER